MAAWNSTASQPCVTSNSVFYKHRLRNHSLPTCVVLILICPWTAAFGQSLIRGLHVDFCSAFYEKLLFSLTLFRNLRYFRNQELISYSLAQQDECALHGLISLRWSQQKSTVTELGLSWGLLCDSIPSMIPVMDQWYNGCCSKSENSLSSCIFVYGRRPSLIPVIPLWTEAETDLFF